MRRGHDREEEADVDAHELRAIVERERERRFGCRVLDVRGGTERPGDHLPGSAWLPAVSAEAMPAHMLPERGRDFVVVAARAADARHLAAGLRERGWACRYFTAAPPDDLLEPGPAAGALWQPDPFLAEMLSRLPGPGAGPVLDLGCGSGRESVFLALHGYEVVGVDRLPDALALARQRALHHGVRCAWTEARVRSAEDLPPGPFAAVLNFRVLVRPALRGLAPRLQPDGVLVLRCYGWPDDLDPARDRPPGSGPRQRRDRLSISDLRDDLTDPPWSLEVGPRLETGDDACWLEALARRRVV